MTNYQNREKKQISTLIPLDPLDYLSQEEVNLLDIYGGGRGGGKRRNKKRTRKMRRGGDGLHPSTFYQNQNQFNTGYNQGYNQNTGFQGYNQNTGFQGYNQNTGFQGYNQNQYNTGLINFNPNESNLSYYVVVDLDLYPGEDGIPITQKLVLGCQSRFEKIRRSWAKLFGFMYRPSETYVPDYKPPQTDMTAASNKTRKNTSIFTNNTMVPDRTSFF
jgi:hypothetical protein